MALTAEQQKILNELIEAEQDFSSYSLSEELATNKEFMMEVVKQDVFAFEFAADELKADRNFILEVLHPNGQPLPCCVETTQLMNFTYYYAPPKAARRLLWH